MKNKILLIFIAVMFLVFPVYADAKKAVLEKESVVKKFDDGANYETFFDLVKDDKNIVAVGASMFIKLEDDATTQDRQSIIVKYDEEGNIVKSATYQDDNHKYWFNSIDKTKDGYVVTAVDMEEREISEVIWYDKDLNVIKKHKINYGGNIYTQITDILTVSDGYVAVGFGIAGTQNAGIIKFDLNGNVVWRKDADIEGKMYTKVIQVDDDNFIAVGSKKGYGLFTKFSPKNNTISTVKLDQRDAIQGFTKTSDGNYLITTGNESSSELYKNYLIKLDPNGQIIWEKEMDAPVANGNFDVFEYNNEYYVAKIAIDENLENAGYYWNYVTTLLKYDINGNYISEEKLGSGGRRIVLDNDNLYLVGEQSSENNYALAYLKKYSFKNEYKLIINNKTNNESNTKEYLPGEKINLKDLLGNYDEITITDENGNKIDFSDGILIMPECNVIITFTTEVTTNPKTGTIISFVVAGVGVIGAIGAINYTKKRNKFVK